MWHKFYVMPMSREVTVEFPDEFMIFSRTRPVSLPSEEENWQLIMVEQLPDIKALQWTWQCFSDVFAQDTWLQQETISYVSRVSTFSRQTFRDIIVEFCRIRIVHHQVTVKHTEPTGKLCVLNLKVLHGMVYKSFRFRWNQNCCWHDRTLMPD